jgi:hypothetical protein
MPTCAPLKERLLNAANVIKRHALPVIYFSWSGSFIRALPALYVVWALPLVFILALLVPPWQHPDEPAHFLRAAHAADGNLFGHRFGTTAGGRADPAIGQAVIPFWPLAFHPEVKVTEAMYASAYRRWSSMREDTPFHNTSIYPPFLYAPAILAVWAGRTLHLTIVRSLYVARATNALASVLLTCIALALARRTRCALAVIAGLPMTLALYASASHDALIVSLTLLAVGSIDRVIDEARAATGAELVLITLALLFVAMSRPPYAVLSGLLLLGAPNRSLRAWMAATVIIAGTAIWWTYALRGFVVYPAADASSQWAIAIANPIRTITVAWTSLVIRSPELGEQLIGKLGWLDTPLPHGFVLLAATIILLGYLSALAGPTRWPWLPLIIIIIAALALHGSQYLCCVEPGAANSYLQGRYFLPLAAVLTLALPQLPGVGWRILLLAAVGVTLLASIEPAVLIRTLVIRYYLSAG